MFIPTNMEMIPFCKKSNQQRKSRVIALVPDIHSFNQWKSLVPLPRQGALSASQIRLQGGVWVLDLNTIQLNGLGKIGRVSTGQRFANEYETIISMCLFQHELSCFNKRCCFSVVIHAINHISMFLLTCLPKTYFLVRLIGEQGGTQNQTYCVWCTTLSSQEELRGIIGGCSTIKQQLDLGMYGQWTPGPYSEDTNEERNYFARIPFCSLIMSNLVNCLLFLLHGSQYSIVQSIISYTTGIPPTKIVERNK